MKFVSYIRVSTKEQGISGLGLEAQQRAIRVCAATEGGEIVAEHVEVLSGKDNSRPVLAAALADAKRRRATLLVAKIDRLSRRLSFTAALMEGNVEIVCADNPNANRMTLQILAAVAEAEGKMISERTKAALAAAKARGVFLGSARPGHWDGREHLRGCQRGSKRVDVDEKLVEQCRQLRAEGHSLQTIAERLSAQGYRAPLGGQLTRVQIHRLMLHGTVREGRNLSEHPSSTRNFGQ